MGNSSRSAEEASTRPSLDWCRSHGYTIPDWLLRYSIRCPYVLRSYFQGRHGAINCRRVGDGEHVVLTFHGLNACHSAFDDYSDVLGGNDYSIVSFDMYGHGLSAVPSYDVFGKRFSTDFFVDQAEEVLEYFGLLGRRLSLMGISMGGCIAAAFCARHPGLVDRMILISPAGLIPRRQLTVRFIRLCHCAIPCAPLCICRCCIARGLPAEPVDNTTNHSLWRFFVTPKSTAAILGMIKRVPMWTSDRLYQRIGALCRPTLVFFGGRDGVTPPVCAPKFKRYFRNSHVILFPEACHLASYLMPTEIASTCLAFLALPADAQVCCYARWLPFSEDGSYIRKQDRRIRKGTRKADRSSSGESARSESGDEHTPRVAVSVRGDSPRIRVDRDRASARSVGSGRGGAPGAQPVDHPLMLVTLEQYEGGGQDEPS